MNFLNLTWRNQSKFAQSNSFDLGNDRGTNLIVVSQTPKSDWKMKIDYENMKF